MHYGNTFLRALVVAMAGVRLIPSHCLDATETKMVLNRKKVLNCKKKLHDVGLRRIRWYLSKGFVDDQNLCFLFNPVLDIDVAERLSICHQKF